MEVPVEPAANTDLTPGGEGDEVPRYQHILEAVSDFELAKPAVVLVPVIELAVGEIRHASLRASLYGTGQ